jgi:hypothetical protein
VLVDEWRKLLAQLTAGATGEGGQRLIATLLETGKAQAASERQGGSHPMQLANNQGRLIVA